MTGAGVVQADNSCSFRGGPGDREVPSHVALPIRTGRMQHHERGFNGQSQHCGRASKPWATLHRHPLGPEVAHQSVTPCLVTGVRSTAAGRKLPAQGTDRLVLVRFIDDVTRRCGDSAEVLAVAGAPSAEPKVLRRVTDHKGRPLRPARAECPGCEF